MDVGADLGVILLVFALGLEYSGERLSEDLHCALPAGIKDLIVNFAPGVVAGFILGWDVLSVLLLGGGVYISSSGIIAKLLTDLDRLDNDETPVILSVLVLEDIAMAVFFLFFGLAIDPLTLGPVLVPAISLGWFRWSPRSSPDGGRPRTRASTRAAACARGSR